MSEQTHKESRHISLFGPIVLIALGLLFLFNRLNTLTDLHWLDLLRLWPLLLIFLGLNLIATQAPRPYASLLSGLIALIAVIVFGTVLLNGLPGTPFNNRGMTGNWQTDSVQFSAEGVETAVYNMIIGPPGADLYALEDSNDLLAGTITFQDDYLFDTDLSGSQASIRLEPQNNSEEWVFMPNYWRDYGETNRWQLGLNGNIPSALTLEAVAGRSQLDLRDLQLDSLTLATNAGDTELFMPGGNYDANLVTNAANTKITLPETGRHTINLQVNAGAVTLHLPPEMALRVAVDRTLGTFSAANSGLHPLGGQENVWQTAGYGDAQDQVDLNIHIPLGAVTID